MGDNQVLIAYGTKMGATAEAASEIANILRDKYGLEVDVINLKENPSPDLSQYKNVIIGSGVAYGRWVNDALQFLENNFEGKKVAVFVSSSTAGDSKSYDEAFTRYIKDVLAKYPHIKPIATEAFGGRIKFLSVTFSDNRDIEKIRSWASEVGKKFSELNEKKPEEIEDESLKQVEKREKARLRTRGPYRKAHIEKA